MATTQTPNYDVQELMARPTLTSEEAAYLLGDRKVNKVSQHARMLVLHQKGCVSRVPGVVPYAWTTKSVLEYIESLDRKPRKNRTAVGA